MIKIRFLTIFGLVWASFSSSGRKTIHTYRVKVEKLENSKKCPSRPPGPRGWGGDGRPHNPPLGPMGPHGSFMVAPLFNDEAAESRYGAQWAPQGSPKSRARRQKICFGGSPPRTPPCGSDNFDRISGQMPPPRGRSRRRRLVAFDLNS